MNILVAVLFLLMSFLCGVIDAEVSQKMQDIREVSQAMQDIHKEIGDKLIALRNKEHPQAQQPVYTVLDQVGMLHRKAQEVCTANLALEQEIENKDKACKAALEELAVLKSKFAQARNEVKQMGDKLAAYQAEQQKAEQQKKEADKQIKDELKEEKEEKKEIVSLTQAELEFKNKLLSKLHKKNELLYQKNS